MSPVNSESVTVPMPEDMKTWIANQAAAERRTMAEIVRFCVEKEMVWQKILKEKETSGSEYPDPWNEELARHRQVSYEEGVELLKKQTGEIL